VRYLRRNERRVYADLERKGKLLRSGLDKALNEGGVRASTTGIGSLFLTHFPQKGGDGRDDKQTTNRYALRMMSRGFFNLPGHPGAVSTAHTDGDLRRTIEAAADFR